MSNRTRSKSGGDMRPEYDFSGGTRGKHARQARRGHIVKIRTTDGSTVIQHFTLAEGAVLLAPDVREYFSDSDSVNAALRALIGLVPRKRRRARGN
jgi:hypothetical protein